jgi:hypothetical protein
MFTDDTEDPTPWEPPLDGTEAEHLLGALDRLRWTFRFKTDGLDAAGLDTRIGASTLALGGLLKHLRDDVRPRRCPGEGSVGVFERPR